MMLNHIAPLPCQPSVVHFKRHARLEGQCDKMYLALQIGLSVQKCLPSTKCVTEQSTPLVQDYLPEAINQAIKTQEELDNEIGAPQGFRPSSDSQSAHSRSDDMLSLDSSPSIIYVAVQVGPSVHKYLP